MRLVDAMLSIPPLLLLLALVSGMRVAFLLDTSLDFYLVAIGIGLIGVPAYGRYTRSVIHDEMHQPYMLGLQAIGASSWHIMRFHIWPRMRMRLFTLSASYFGGALLAASSLSFAGLSYDPINPDLGKLIVDHGATVFRSGYWWLLVGS